MAELIHEHAAHVRTPEGDRFSVRTYGESRNDGTWIGWLEFEPQDRDVPQLRTEPETTQASRDALDVWASGLEPVYLEGAFARAHVVSRR
jgi:hypothetical protein